MELSEGLNLAHPVEPSYGNWALQRLSVDSEECYEPEAEQKISSVYIRRETQTVNVLYNYKPDNLLFFQQ